MPAGAKRTGQTRSLIDSTKKHLLGLPLDRRRVQRRVKPDQVSSYSMRVHTKPAEKEAIDLDLFNSRDIDPGEAERSRVPGNYIKAIDSLLYKAPEKLIKGIYDRRRHEVMRDVAGLVLGTLVKDGRIDLVSHILESAGRDFVDWSSLGRSTWRQIARDPDLRALMTNIRQSDPDYVGEVALNSNTIYRQGTDVLGLVTPYLDDVMAKIDYVTLDGGQQMFNTGRLNVIPSAIYPTDSYGYDKVSVGLKDSKNSWVFTPANSAPVHELVEALNPKDGLRIHPIGFLPKTPRVLLHRGESQFQFGGLIIPFDIARKVMSGFRIFSRDGENSVYVYPDVGAHTLSPGESHIRSTLVQMTASSPMDLHRSAKNKGRGGYGHHEIDIYNMGQYFWKDGHRSRSTQEQIVKAVFPHPLLSYMAANYRDDYTEDIVMEEICNLAISSLPIIPR